ncbi:hypothetical protein B7463_g10047, partial [Scytalidium lignicola]
MRLPYVSDPISARNDAEAAIIDRVRERRKPGLLLELDRALLYSPSIADGWNSLFGSIRQQSSLSADIRELAICHVAVLNKAQFEWTHHAPLAAEAGVNLEALKLDGEGLTRKQLAVFRYTDDMKKYIFVKEEVFQELKFHFTDVEVVEITATVAVYNCCSRFLVALDVGERNGMIEINQW